MLAFTFLLKDGNMIVHFCQFSVLNFG